MWQFGKTVFILPLHGVPLPHPHPLPDCCAGSRGREPVSYFFQALLADRAETLGKADGSDGSGPLRQVEWSPRARAAGEAKRD